MVKFSITNKIIEHISNISASNAIISALPLPRNIEQSLHQKAIVKSTHYSTKIEGNLITLEKVETMLKGEEIVARQKDIDEIKNYKKSLDYISCLNEKISTEIIFEIYNILMNHILNEESHNFRESQNTICRPTGEVIYMPPRARDVPKLMDRLISWYHSQTVHPLIKIAVFHYQYVTIHPFLDGNGRSARVISEYLLRQNGYDTRKLIALDNYYEENLSEYYHFLDFGKDFYDHREGCDISDWIVFYLRSMDIVYDIIRLKAIKLFELNESKLEEREKIVKDYILENGTITSLEFADILKISKRRARTILSTFAQNRFITPKANTKPIKYTLTE